MTMKKLFMAGGAAALLTATTAYASIIDRPFFKVLGVVVVWGADAMDGAAPVVSDFVLLTPATGTAGADLIGADGATVVTGTMTPISATGDNELAGASVADPVTGQTSGGVFTDDGDGLLNAADTLTAFGIDSTTDVDAVGVTSHTSSFYVASNAAFDIWAQSSALSATGDFTSLSGGDISFAMAVTTSGTDGGLAFGANAQTPTTGGTGYDATRNDLADLSTAVKVYDGGRRTAASPGSLTQQSVRFDNTYELAPGGVTGYDLSMGSGTVSADVTFTIYVP